MNQITWDFAGKTALVTGGSQGIGEAVVRKLRQAGAYVIFTYTHHEEMAARIVAECGESFVTAVCVDYTDQDSMARWSEFLSTLTHLDYLVNNAGMIRDGPLYTMPEQNWRDVLEVNLTALFPITQALLPILASSKGSIVNVASISGISGTAGQTNYSSAKAGMIGFTKALSREAGPLGVRVNAVAPGYINTSMTKPISDKKKNIHRSIPLRRFGTSDEIAAVVLFLLSDASSYVTGSVLVADGGLY